MSASNDDALRSEALFETYFLPLYPEDAKADLFRARTENANPGNNPVFLGHIDDAADRFQALAEGLLHGSLDGSLDGSDASVHRLSAAFTPEWCTRLMAEGRAGTAESALFNFVVHGTFYVGRCIVTHHGGTWSIRRPLWESVVLLDSPLGSAALSVFHWLLRSAVREGGATLADRYRAYVEIPCAKVSLEAPFIRAEASAPRLKTPRYDTLYKWVKAHLPELRDLGKDFPSGERFAEYGFRWLDAHVVGGGRRVVFAGHTTTGLHLFWLGSDGFDKAVYIPCDSFPDPVVRTDKTILSVLCQREGLPRRFEYLWWGP